MWFVSKKKYDALLAENTRLKANLEHAQSQIRVIATLYREELDDHKQFYKNVITQLAHDENSSTK